MSREPKISEEKIKMVLANYPSSFGNNTLFLQAFYETVCSFRGIENSWDNVKAIMLEYKPESVMRSRREFVESTKAQRIVEEEFHSAYTKDHC